ncbi:MAG: phytochrome, partial [Sphingobacteriales bacterium]
VHSRGDVPNSEDLKHLVFWLQHKALQQSFAENGLFAAFEPAGGYVEIASGILAIPIGNKNEDFLLLFRPELQATVNWSGNPADAINFEPDGKKYHPRSSFAIWQETVKHKSLPWNAEELELAESLRTFIFEYSTKRNF